MLSKLEIFEVEEYNENMHIQTVIQQLGYRPHEAKVYLASLALGESTIIDLAQKTKLPRTSVQSIVQTLHQGGLLNLYLKKRRKYWIAENPEKLLIRIKESEAALKNIMPELQAMRYHTGLRPTVRLYSGLEGISQVMEDMLETKRHILAIMSWDDWLHFTGEDFLKDFIKSRAEHFLKIKLAVPRTTLSAQLKKRDATEMRTTKFLPETYHLKNANFIYGNKVAIISLNKRMPLGIVIEDQDVTQTMTLLFTNLWSQCVDR